MDEETDPADDQSHQNGEGIDLVADHCLERTRDDPIKNDFFKKTFRGGSPDQFEEDEEDLYEDEDEEDEKLEEKAPPGKGRCSPN
jgi:hypothetical protein